MQDERTQFRDERERPPHQWQWQRKWQWCLQRRPVVTEPAKGLVDDRPDQRAAQIHDGGDVWLQAERERRQSEEEAAVDPGALLHR